MGTFSIWHWLIVLLVVVLVFGSKKLVNVGPDLGKAIRGFQKSMRDGAKSEDAGENNTALESRESNNAAQAGAAPGGTTGGSPGGSVGGSEKAASS